MADQYWFAGVSGGSLEGKTFHVDKECPALDPGENEHRRPASASVLDEDAIDLCGDCTPLGDESGGGSEESVETCDAEMTNGEVCGRERPCPYHD